MADFASMDRRGFLGVLAALPFVGKLVPKAEPLSYAEKGYPEIYSEGGFRTGLPTVQFRQLNEGVMPVREILTRTNELLDDVEWKGPE